MLTVKNTVKTLTAVALAATLCAIAVSCGSSAGEDAALSGGERTLASARTEFSAAADALRRQDRTAFAASVPVAAGTAASVRAVRESLSDMYEALSPLPWREFSFEVEALGDGVYRVRGSGRLGSGGPPDRLAVVRYFRLRQGADGAAVVADETPDEARRRYLMALRNPVALRRHGVIVLADGRARSRARRVLAAAERARRRLTALGVDTRADVLVTVYGSAEDVRDALGTDAATARLRFFAHPALRAADDEWPVYDVGVMGPWLRDPEQPVDDLLTHELAHAYTMRWFRGVEHPSALLVEGIAEAAEGCRVTAGLRREMASGNQLWPLPESFACSDVWQDATAEDVSLGYQIGGSLVDYVVARWGAGKLRPFIRAAAVAEPTEAGFDEALEAVLGVKWRAFYAGWRRFVLDGG